MRKLEFFKRFTYTPNDFYDYQMKVENAMSGDVELNIIPAEADKEEIEIQDMDGHTQDVTVQVVNDDGDVLDFYNGKLNVQVVNGSEGDGGTVQINDEDPGGNGEDVDQDLQFSEGELTFTVTYGDGDGWAAGDEVKITVDKDDKDIMGYAVKVQNHDILEVQANT